jgi:TonB family protein
MAKTRKSLEPFKSNIRSITGQVWILFFFFCLSLPRAQAAELTLNGLASHQELQAEYFIAALYLPSPSKNLEEILAMTGQKRMEMRVTHDNFSPRKFAGLWRDSLVINNSPADIEKFGTDMLKFSSVMGGKLVTGDQVVIEYRPNSATVISVNGNELARFNEDFFPLLLRTWIGPRPTSSDFKRDLLAAGKLNEQLKNRYPNIVPLDGRKQMATLWGSGGADAAAAETKARAEAAALAEQQAKAEAEARAQAEAKAKAEAEARAQAEAKAKAEAEARAQAEAKAKAEAEARAQAKAKAEAEAKAKAEAETKALAEAAAAEEAARLAATKASSNIQAKADAEAKAKLAAEAKAKAKAEAEARAQAEAKAKAEAEARAQAEAKAKAEAEARTQAEAKAKAEAEARTQAEAKAKAEAEARTVALAKAAEEAKKRNEQELAAKQAATTVSASTGSATSEDEGAVQLSAADLARELYKSRLVAHVYKSLEYPEKDKRARKEGNIQLQLSVNRQGGLVGDITMLEESRYATLNFAARTAARLSQPYPAIPKEIEGESFQFEVPILFRAE